MSTAMYVQQQTLDHWNCNMYHVTSPFAPTGCTHTHGRKEREKVGESERRRHREFIVLFFLFAIFCCCRWRWLLWIFFPLTRPKRTTWNKCLQWLVGILHNYNVTLCWERERDSEIPFFVLGTHITTQYKYRLTCTCIHRACLGVGDTHTHKRVSSWVWDDSSEKNCGGRKSLNIMMMMTMMIIIIIIIII